MKRIFSYNEIVRIYDTDAQGVVHYAGYYRFFTDAAESIMEKLLGREYLIKGNNWFVVAESKAVYHRPSMLGDKLKILISIDLLSRKSLRLNFSIKRKSELICSGYIVHVFIDKKRWKGVNMPKSILDKLNNR